MNNSLAGLLIVVTIIVLVVGCAWHFRWHFHRSRTVLERWAERNGYRLREAEYRHVFRGPFFWSSSKGQTVYRVTVEGKDRVRTGWVRCGGWFLGLLSDHAEVRWDEPPVRTPNPMHDQWIDG
jgi:hypothetical protein